MKKAARTPPKRRLAIAVTCIDWRLHLPGTNLSARLAKLLKVDAVNICAIPGPDALLHKGRETDWKVVRDWFKLLIPMQNPVIIAMVAHETCLANPEAGLQHARDVQKVATAVKKATGFRGPVAAVLMVHKSDTHWLLKRLGKT